MPEPVHVVTGAFGYSGRWIAKELLSRGKRVRTLTNAKGRDDPFHGRVEVLPIDFAIRVTYSLNVKVSGPVTSKIEFSTISP